MKRLYDTFRLTERDPIAGAIRWRLASEWPGVVRVSPGEVALTTPGDRISDDDPAFPRENWKKFVTGFRFAEADQVAYDSHAARPNEGWYPQGITGSADADDSGAVDSRKFLLVSWYSRNPGALRADVIVDEEGKLTDLPALEHRPCTRVSLIDVTDMDEVKYRHILLVEPTDRDGVPDFVSLVGRDAAGQATGVVHAGGCVWYGRWLFVASGDLLVFDMEALSDISKQNTGYAASTTVGYDGERYHAFGYQYVLPLRYRLAFSTPGSTIQFGEGSGPFATIGLDRGSDPPRLVAAQFVVPEDFSGSSYDREPDHRLVVFWDLDPGTDLPESDASEAANHGLHYVQGVNADRSTVWFSRSAQFHPTEEKTTYFTSLRVQTLGASGSEDYQWARAAEGLTYAPTTDHLWCVTEFHGDLICFCVNREDVGR